MKAFVLLFALSTAVTMMEPAILYGVGPRVAESALGLITNTAGSAPYEDINLKTR